MQVSLNRNMQPILYIGVSWKRTRCHVIFLKKHQSFKKLIRHWVAICSEDTPPQCWKAAPQLQMMLGHVGTQQQLCSVLGVCDCVFQNFRGSARWKIWGDEVIINFSILWLFHATEQCVQATLLLVMAHCVGHPMLCWWTLCPDHWCPAVRAAFSVALHCASLKRGSKTEAIWCGFFCS